LASLEIWADTTVELYVGEKKLLDAMPYMNLSNAISNVKFAIDSDKLHEREEGWSVVVAPNKFYDGEATVKCTWIEKDQHTPYPYTTYNRSQTWRVRCKDNPIVLNTTELRLKPGESGDIQVDCTNRDVSYFYNCKYTWHFSTKNSSVATVQQTGLVKAVGIGQTEIVISSPNAKDDKYCKVIVAEIPDTKVTSITLNKSSLSLEAGKSETLTATVKPDNATDKTVKWTSSSTSVATVDSNGKVTAVDKGNATITCEANDGSGVKATCAVTVSGSTVIEINATNFPDAGFRNWLLSQSYGADGKLTPSEIASVTSINVSGTSSLPGSIVSLKGIEFFTALTRLDCRDNQLSSIDLHELTALEMLDCRWNQLTELDVSSNTALKDLSCSHNNLKTLDVSKNTALWHLGVDSNQLTAIDVSKNTIMEQFDCSSNQLTVLDISKNVALEYLYCGGNQLTVLDISKNVDLEYLYCYSNQLTDLDLSKNISLKAIRCFKNRLTSLDVSKCKALTELYFYLNQIKGANMDALIKSLPINSGAEPYVFYVVENPTKETNVCTVSQVEATKSRGWQPYYGNFPNLKEYEGSDEVIEVTSISLNKSSLSLQPEESETLTATVKPDNATDKSVSWSSDMKSVATVDNNGKVTAKAAGTATITCKANDGSGVKATCAVTVSDPEPPYPADIWFVSVTCDNTNLDNLTKNDKLSMHATFENKGGTDEIYSMLALINLEATKIVANGDYDVREFKGGMTTTVDYEYALDTIPAGQYYATVLYYDWNEESWFYHGKESLYLITVKDNEPNPIVPGDVNGDGSANGTDLVALTNIILGKSDRTAAADVNGDGQVNGTDYVALVNIVLGRNNSRAVEYPKTDKRLNTPSKGIKIVDRKRIIKK